MIEFIKTKIKKLYKDNKLLHIKLKENSKSKNYIEMEAKITEIYNSFFTIENQSDKQKKYSIQYNNVITKEIIIEEMGVLPEIPKY